MRNVVRMRCKVKKKIRKVDTIFEPAKAGPINIAYPSRPESRSPISVALQKSHWGHPPDCGNRRDTPSLKRRGRKERRTSNENPPRCAGVGGHPVRARACATVALRRAEPQPLRQP